MKTYRVRVRPPYHSCIYDVVIRRLYGRETRKLDINHNKPKPYTTTHKEIQDLSSQLSDT